jgi:hypothetical protein
MNFREKVLIYAICLLIPICAWSKKKILHVKVEKPYSASFQFPEERYLKNKNDVGIAFSGGGSRAASATLGQLRALNQLHLLDKVKYISCVSGGSWASVCYTYLPSSYSDEQFLGKYMPPEKLTWKELTNNDPKKGSLAYCISRGYVFYRFFAEMFQLKGDEIFASLLNDVYLKRLGLGNRQKFFTYSKAYLQEILQRNNSLASSDFYTVNEKANRPFLIVNSTLIGGVRNAKGLPSMHMEVTPIYSGITYHHKETKHPVGGGYYETFGIDTKREPHESKQEIVTSYLNAKKHVFALSDAMAMSGSAFGTFANRARRGLQNVGFPEITLWSPYQYRNNRFQLDNPNMEFAIGDGGNSENLGVIPLLKRKVGRIIVFVNSLQPICKNGDSIIIDDAILRLFGEFGNTHKMERNIMACHVLKNKGKLAKLKRELLDLKNSPDKAVIYTDTYEVNKNEKYGVYTKGYNSVQITWVYGDNAKRFLQAITNEDLQDKINHGKFNQPAWRLVDSAGKFPFYATFLNTPGMRILDYNRRHVHFLAAFSSWIVMDNKDRFERIINMQ